MKFKITVASHCLLCVLLTGSNSFFIKDVVASEARRPVRVSDLDLLKEVSVPRISPDGQWVAYTITEVDVEADTTRIDLWLSRWDGNKTVRLTASPESEHSPRWSPDGKTLAFLSTGPDTGEADQIWLIEPNGGEPRRITTLENGVSEFDWAPDSKRIALVSGMLPEGTPPDQPGGPIVIDRLLYKQDAYGYLGKERSRVHLLDLEDGSVVQLTNGPFDEITPSFSPDGKHIAYLTKQGEDPDRHDNWDIFRIDATAGAQPGRVSQSGFMECDPIWGWSWESKPEWSPDGRSLVCIQSGDLKYSWFTLHQVVTFPAKGGSGTQLTVALDRNTTAPKYSADGKRVFFLLEEDRHTQLASVGTDGKNLQHLTTAGRTVSAFDLGPGDKIALLSSSPSSPAEIFVLDKGELRQLTHANANLLKSVQFLDGELLNYPGTDGSELTGMIMKPPGFVQGKKYPAILRLHGGPGAQWAQEFDFGWQVLAAAGYVIFGPNPHGSTGRGEAFMQSVMGQGGYVDVPDILAAADFLVAQGIADENHLGVGGWSYGSILTNYVIASDTRFKAATSGAGISNMLAGFGTDEWWKDWEAELGLPWETPENWLRSSYPFLHADRIKTPTLFLAGSEDYNVPMIHSEQMYVALKRLGVPTRLVIYPGQNHSIPRPSFQRDVLSRYLAWYQQWLAATQDQQL